MEPPIEFGRWLARSMKIKYGEWKDAFPELSVDSDEETADVAMTPVTSAGDSSNPSPASLAEN